MTSRLIIAIVMFVVLGLMARVTTSQPPAPQAPSVQPTATQTPPAPVQPPAPASVVVETDHGTALMLLDRVATLLDDAVQGKSAKSGVVGTTGSSDHLVKVVVDRATLDELRAEVAQIKLLLQDNPSSSVALRPRGKTGEAR